MALLEDLMTFLDTQSTALAKLSGNAGNLSISYMPDASPAPNTMVTIYETQGVTNGYSFSTSTGADVVFERPRVQVISRSTSYVTARTNAQTVYTILDGLARNLPTSTGTAYLSIAAAHAPFSIGRDETQRHLVSCSFDIIKAVG